MKVSECCGAANVSNGDTDFAEFGICPSCKDHCTYIDDEENDFIMNTEQQKLDAALNVVSNSILHGWTIDAKVDYIGQILPENYKVKESVQKGNVHCKSTAGINDDEQWEYFMQALKQRFTDFSEVSHNTCHNHVDFTVYFKSNQTK